MTDTWTTRDLPVLRAAVETAADYALLFDVDVVPNRNSTTFRAPLCPFSRMRAGQADRTLFDLVRLHRQHRV